MIIQMELRLIGSFDAITRVDGGAESYDYKYLAPSSLGIRVLPVVWWRRPGHISIMSHTKIKLKVSEWSMDNVKCLTQ